MAVAKDRIQKSGILKRETTETRNILLIQDLSLLRTSHIKPYAAKIENGEPAFPMTKWNYRIIAIEKGTPP